MRVVVLFTSDTRLHGMVTGHWRLTRTEYGIQDWTSVVVDIDHREQVITNLDRNPALLPVQSFDRDLAVSS